MYLCSSMNDYQLLKKPTACIIRIEVEYELKLHLLTE
jgi:hypothetical protein